MLARPPKPPTDDRKAALRRARDRRRYKRRAAGIAVAPTPYDRMMLDYLIRLRWLAECDSRDPVKVGAAIAAAMRESAEAARK